jgi:methyl-accepting chemotaxis protein
MLDRGKPTTRTVARGLVLAACLLLVLAWVRGGAALFCGTLAVSAGFLAFYQAERRAVRGALSRLAGRAGAATGEGPDEPFPVEGPEEVRDLARALNGMSDRLRARTEEILARVRDAESRLETLTARHLSGAEPAAPEGVRHSDFIVDVTSSVDELCRSSRQIRTNAQSVREAAGQTSEMAQQGTVLIRESVEATARMQSRVSDIMDKNRFLAEKSREIDKVLDLVRDIARETRLLSLNAALEATIAGETGRRFATVATEVRRLSESTRHSIDAVSAIIFQVRAAIDDSVAASEQGLREAERSREAIDLSADAFSEIIEGIEKTSMASTQIVWSTEQQSSAEEQLAGRMRQVSGRIKSMSDGLREFASAAASLREALENVNPRE